MKEDCKDSTVTEEPTVQAGAPERGPWHQHKMPDMLGHHGGDR